jgi:hypothetical protein
MAFDKDNFEEDNELAPLEEEEAGDVDEVAGVEIEERVADDDTEDEPELPKRSATGPKRGSAGTSGSTASKASAGKGSSRSGGAKAPAKKASVGKSKSSAGKSAKKKSGGARGKASKKPAKKAARGGKKKKR